MAFWRGHPCPMDTFLVHRSRASNSKKNDLIWPKFEPVPDFMPLLDTCKFEEVVIKTEGALPPAMSNMFCFFYHSRANNSKELYNMAEIRTCQRFYACPSNQEI